MIKFLKRILVTPEWFCYIIAMTLEIVGIYLICSVHGSICIRTFEMTTPVMVFLLFNAVALFPDFIYIILILFFNKLAKEPMAVVYNLTIGLLCVIASGCLAAMLTYCGNIAQETFAAAAIIGIVAGFVHLTSGFYTHWFMPKKESYLWKPRWID